LVIDEVGILCEATGRMSRIMALETVGKIGESVLLKGWVHTRRDMGKLAFIDLRDRSGLVQVILHPAELDDASKELMKELRGEFCIEVQGVVQKRGEKQLNPNMPTGTVEVVAKKVGILNAAKPLPFELEDTMKVSEELRLKYRYLDLRSPRLQRNLRLRDQIITLILFSYSVSMHFHCLALTERQTIIQFLNHIQFPNL
jgi:aspartyl-tRNA synthetase